MLCTLAPPQWLPRRGALDHRQPKHRAYQACTDLLLMMSQLHLCSASYGVQILNPVLGRAPPESLHPVQGAPGEVRCRTDQRDVVGVARRQKALRRPTVRGPSRIVTLPPYVFVRTGGPWGGHELTPSHKSVPNPDLWGRVCRSRVPSALLKLRLARWDPTPGGEIKVANTRHVRRTLKGCRSPGDITFIKFYLYNYHEV